LVLTTTFSKIAGLQIELPSASLEEPLESLPNEIAVAITATGDVLVDGQPVAASEVEAIAAALGRARPPMGAPEPLVVINADARVAHQHVIDVMQAAQRVGLGHISFAVQEPKD
jgi:biopolymer transport protein ExbD